MFIMIVRVSGRIFMRMRLLALSSPIKIKEPQKILVKSQIIA